GLHGARYLRVRTRHHELVDQLDRAQTVTPSEILDEVRHPAEVLGATSHRQTSDPSPQRIRRISHRRERRAAGAVKRDRIGGRRKPGAECHLTTDRAVRSREVDTDEYLIDARA